METGGIAGIQVKSISVDTIHPRGAVNVPRNTYRVTAATYIVVLAERRRDLTLHPQCLLIPSANLGGLLIDHAGELSFTWDPDSRRDDASVAPYRCPVAELPARIAALLD
ncbi:MAG: hypothetical protein ACR2GX_00155 [Candidatus Dormibacteria bacterium]